jgi:hypothetical protein
MGSSSPRVCSCLLKIALTWARLVFTGRHPRLSAFIPVSHAAPSSFTVRLSHAPVCRPLDKNNPHLTPYSFLLVTAHYRIASYKVNSALETTPLPTNLPSTRLPIPSRI